MNEELMKEETMADYEDHFDDANPWNLVQKYMRQGTVLSVKVEGIVNGGVIAMVEGLRGFIPASKLSLSYIENLEDYLLQELKVQVIDVDQAENRLILSARELLKEKERQEKADKISRVPVGAILSGTCGRRSRFKLYDHKIIIALSVVGYETFQTIKEPRRL